jgi:hypothetical protein
VPLNFGFRVFGVTNCPGKPATAHEGAVTPASRARRASARRAGRWSSGWPSGLPASAMALSAGDGDRHLVPQERIQPGGYRAAKRSFHTRATSATISSSNPASSETV